MIIIVHAQCSWIVHPKWKILTLIIFSSSCFPKPVWDYSIFLFSESRQMLSSLFKTQKHYKSGPYDLWAIVHVFWSHIISLCDVQTKMYYSLIIHSLRKSNNVVMGTLETLLHEDLKTLVSNHSSSEHLSNWPSHAMISAKAASLPHTFWILMVHS